MADTVSKRKRSQIMRRVRSKNTNPELLVRSLLHKSGYRFRLHKADLPGNPDIVLPKFKTVIFVHGCFWHRHSNCRKGQSTPSTNRRFWNEKFEKTVLRDQKARKTLKKMGWKVIVIWECQLSNEAALLSTLKASLPVD